MRARPALYGLIVFATGIATGHWLSRSTTPAPPSPASQGVAPPAAKPAASPLETTATVESEAPPALANDASRPAATARPAAREPTDPRAALAQASAISGARRLERAEAIGGDWARESPEVAYRFAAEIADPALRAAFVRGVLRSWARREPAAVIGILSTSYDALGQEAVAAIVDGLVGGDPATAFAVFYAEDEDNVPFQTVRAFLNGWAARDPTAAARAYEGVSSDDAHGGIYREVFGDILGQRWAERDPDAAIAWATRAGQQAWGGVLVGLAATDPERALRVASSLPSQRSLYVNGVIATIADKDPEAAATYWQHAGIAEISGHTANRIMQAWVRRDSAAAEQWALALPAGEGRDAALATFVGHSTLHAVHAAELINSMLTERVKVVTASSWIRSALERRDPTVAEFENRLQLSASARAEVAARARR